MKAAKAGLLNQNQSVAIHYLQDQVTIALWTALQYSSNNKWTEPYVHIGKHNIGHLGIYITISSQQLYQELLITVQVVRHQMQVTILSNQNVTMVCKDIQPIKYVAID